MKTKFNIILSIFSQGMGVRPVLAGGQQQPPQPAAGMPQQQLPGGMPPPTTMQQALHDLFTNN